MVDRPNKPTALATTPGLPPQAQVNITHDNSRVAASLPTGESVEVLLHGATVLSWKDAAGAERLWLSEATALDGSKAVRGGIPLVFPVFGTSPDHPEVGKLPQHGLARISRWEFLGKSTSESASDSVKLDFGLSSENVDEKTRALWPYKFGAIYSVTLDRESLSTSIVITNQGDVPFEVQVLLHTYLRVKDVTAIQILNLDASPYTDKTDNLAKKTQSGPLKIASETDAIFTPAGGPKTPIIVADAADNTKEIYSIVRDSLDDVVIWNPWEAKAKSMPDFAPDDGWRNMICVEAGAVNGFQKLEAGDALEGAQVITSGAL